MKRTSRSLLFVALVAALLWLGTGGPPQSLEAQVSPYGYWVAPGACISAVSGNATGTQQQTVVGTSNHPVVQASTSATGANTHTYRCNLAPPAYLVTSGARIRILDAVFFYGQQTGLGTQSATLASGTFNSATVFSYVDYPSPGTSETSSVEAPVRADAGTLLITPVAASFNVTTTTAGRFFSAKFTPATAIGWNTDLRQLVLTVTLNAASTIATVTNSPGVLVHVTSQ